VFGDDDGVVVVPWGKVHVSATDDRLADGTYELALPASACYSET